jgi:threonine/homoserine efflux transporter RhtA
VLASPPGYKSGCTPEVKHRLFAAVGVGHLNLGIIIDAATLAVLLPVLPFAMEMPALRRMTATAFGTLMAVKPTLHVLLQKR